MTNPRLLCDLVQAYGPTSGGIRTYVDAKRRFLAERSDRFRHVLVIPGPDDGVSVEGNLTTYTVAAPLLPGTGGYRFTPRMDKVHSILCYEQPEIVEVGSPYLMPWAAFLYREGRRGRGRRPIIVGHYHTDFPQAYVEATLARARGAGTPMGRRFRSGAVRAARRYVRTVYSRFDVVVTGAPSFLGLLREEGIRNVELNPLGVDLATFSPMRRDPTLRLRLGLDPRAPLLVYAGRLDQEKRPHFLLEAFLRLPDRLGAHLLLIGEGPERGRLTDRSLRHPRVRVLAYLQDKQELARYLASADLYVTAGRHETFGLSVLEAQACGLPVVGVRAGALVDRVLPAEGALAEPESPEHFAWCVERVLGGDPQAMGRKARARLEREFSWDRCFDRFFALCDAAPTRQASRAARAGGTTVVTTTVPSQAEP